MMGINGRVKWIRNVCRRREGDYDENCAKTEVYRGSFSISTIDQEMFRLPPFIGVVANFQNTI